jgi:hypothetical protein
MAANFAKLPELLRKACGGRLVAPAESEHRPHRGRGQGAVLNYVENWSLFLDIKIILMILFSEKSYSRADGKKSGK